MGEADEPPLDRIKSRAKAEGAKVGSSSRANRRHDHAHVHGPSNNGNGNGNGHSGSGDVNSNAARPPNGSTSRAQPAAASVAPHKKTQGEVTSADNDKESNNLTPNVKKEEEKEKEKGPIPTRMKNGFFRFGTHTKNALLKSWVNVLLVFVPIGIAVNFAHLPPAVVFSMNAVAIVPLAGLLSHATEQVAIRLGDTLGALLNVSFGNAVELIIFIIALAKNQLRIVQASILGSILANLLLILGMAFFLGGMRFQEQIYNSTVTQTSVVLLSLSVMSLLLPTAFYASWADAMMANQATLKVSRGTSVILLIVYVLYLLFQLKSHAYLYASTPQQIIDEESHPGIFHDAFNSSSSSSSSDSSSDSDSDTSNGSHTTAKRIKRAFRRRRKSSVSSKDMPSLPSMTSSPTMETDQVLSSTSRNPSRRTSTLDPVVSGDEADGEAHRFGASVTRDFETRPTSRPPVERKTRGGHARRHRHKKRNASRSVVDADGIAPATVIGETVAEEPETQVADEKEQQQAEEEKKLEAHREKVVSRNPFNVRVMRPPMPKLMSQNVFTHPPVGSGTPAPAPRPQLHRAAATVSYGIRRVRSLPNNLKEAPAAPHGPSRSAAVQFSRSSTRGIAPSADPQVEADEDEEAELPTLSRTAAVVLLLISTGLVAICAEFMVDAIPKMTASSPVSQTFIGLIILPIVGNAAEHVTAVTVAAKNKMDLAIGVAVGSSIQIALFVTPLVVLLGWCMDKAMTLYFNLFETVSLFVTVFVVNFLVLDGRSNYLEGALLMAAYVIIAVAAFFYPDGSAQSALGGNGT